MAPDKSLAAEIEAAQIIFEAIYPHLRYERQSPENRKPFELAAAALQNRAFEDGERAMRQRAEDVARAWMMPKLSATAQDFVSEQHIAERRVRNEAVIGIAAAIAALQPEGERSDA